MSRLALAALCCWPLYWPLCAGAHESDQPFAGWFKGLLRPGTGTSCCSVADCVEVEHRIAGDHYEIFVDEHWLAVPDAVILHRIPNPTGRAVACRSAFTGELLCFVPSLEM